MKCLVTVIIDSGREAGKFSILYPSLPAARVALVGAMPALSAGGNFQEAQLCFENLIDGQPVQELQGAGRGGKYFA